MPEPASQEQASPTFASLTPQERQTLLRGDLQRRWQQGQTVQIEQYYHYCPELETDRETLLNLVATEIELRRNRGELPTLQEYQQRFPQLGPAVSTCFPAHKPSSASTPQMPSYFTSEARSAPKAPEPQQDAEPLSPPQDPQAPQVDTPQKPPATVVLDQKTTPHEIAGHEILGEMGRDELGIVYRARHPELNRLVALKMFLHPDHANEQEAKAIAKLDHPNIVQIHQVGEHEGKPFFSLELIESGSLDTKLASESIPPKEAAQLITKLAEAIHVAHVEGVLHRDLKPSNVLLTEDGTPKITGFGLAKSTSCCAAPELARGKSDSMRPSVDVYGLGAILYECLTGRSPFDAGTAIDTEPIPPEKLNQELDPGLSLVCLKCLHHNAERRYPTAQELAKDLNRYLNGEPIQAQSVGQTNRARTWIRRHPVVSFLMTALLVIFGVSLCRVYLQLGKAETALASERNALKAAKQAKASESVLREMEQIARKQAEQNAKRGRADLYLNQVALAYREWNQGFPEQAKALLHQCPEELRDWEWHFTQRLCHKEILTTVPHPWGLSKVQYSPEGTILSAASWGAKVQNWDPRTGHRLLTFSGHSSNVFGLAYSPDGSRLASAGAVLPTGGEVRIWNVKTGFQNQRLLIPEASAVSVAWSHDGRYLVAGDNQGTIHVWDSTSGKKLREMKGHGGHVTQIVFHPTKNECASASLDKLVKIWNVEKGTEVATLREHGGWVHGLAYNFDGTQIATGGGASSPGVVKIWETKTYKQALVLREHERTVSSVAFSPDGKWLASGSADRKVRIWDVETGDLKATLTGHEHTVSGVAFRPDGKQLASCSWDGTIRTWSFPKEKQERVLVGAATFVTSVTYDPQGTKLATGSSDLGTGAEIRIRNAKTQQVLQTLREHKRPILDLAFSPNGKQLASASYDNSVILWDAEKGTVLHQWNDHPRFPPKCLAFTKDGKILAAAGDGDQVVLWDTATGKKIRELSQNLPAKHDFVNDLSFSDDGKLLAVSHIRKTNVWDVEQGKGLFTVRDDASVVGIKMIGEGKSLISVSGTTVKIWDLGKKRLVKTIYGHGPEASCAAFAPEGQALVTGHSDHTVRVWDLSTGKITTYRGHNDQIEQVAWHPTEEHVASVSRDRTLRLWHLRRSQKQVPLRQGQRAIAFHPEGAQRAVAAKDNLILLQKSATGTTTRTLNGHTLEVTHLDFDKTGQQLLSVAMPDQPFESDVKAARVEAKIWDVASGQPTAGFEASGACLAIHGASRRIAVTQPDKLLLVYDVITMKPILRLENLPTRVTLGAFDPTGKRFAFVMDKTVTVYDLPTKQVHARFDQHRTSVVSLTFDGSGKWLAVGTSGIWDAEMGPGEIHVWDLKTKKLHQGLRGHRLGVHSLAFSPNGNRLISASRDQTMKLWDLKRGTTILTFETFGERLRFSPDGHYLSSATEEHIRLWEAPRDVHP